MNCVPSTQTIGNTFPCTPSVNYGTLSLCLLAAGAGGFTCGFTCAVQPELCIPCILALVAGLGTGCSPCQIVACNLSNTGTPVTGENDSTDGNPCPPPA